MGTRRVVGEVPGLLMSLGRRAGIGLIARITRGESGEAERLGAFWWAIAEAAGEFGRLGSVRLEVLAQRGEDRPAPVLLPVGRGGVGGVRNDLATRREYGL